MAILNNPNTPAPTNSQIAAATSTSNDADPIPVRLGEAGPSVVSQQSQGQDGSQDTGSVHVLGRLYSPDQAGQINQQQSYPEHRFNPTMPHEMLSHPSNPGMQYALVPLVHSRAGGFGLGNQDCQRSVPYLHHLAGQQMAPGNTHSPEAQVNNTQFVRYPGSVPCSNPPVQQNQQSSPYLRSAGFDLGGNVPAQNDLQSSPYLRSAGFDLGGSVPAQNGLQSSPYLRSAGFALGDSVPAQNGQQAVYVPNNGLTEEVALAIRLAQHQQLQEQFQKQQQRYINRNISITNSGDNNNNSNAIYPPCPPKCKIRSLSRQE